MSFTNSKCNNLKDHKEGIEIGSGIDFGKYKTKESFIKKYKINRTEVQNKIKKEFFGLIGKEAFIKMMSGNNVNYFNLSEIEYINKQVFKIKYKEIRDEYMSKFSFDINLISLSLRTVIFSIYHSFGAINNYLKFATNIKEGKLYEAAHNLKNWFPKKKEDLTEMEKIIQEKRNFESDLIMKSIGNK